MRASDIPFMPVEHPEMDTPEEFEHELYAHQKRALHRMVNIETDEKFLASEFNGKKLGTFLSYKARGGCLCDGVGMGKTATTLALICSETLDHAKGPNLLLAPTHLLGQWTEEALKFCPKGVKVITGLQQYQDVARTDPATLNNRTLVVVDAHSVLKSPRYFYDFRRLFCPESNRQLSLSEELEEMYKKKAVSISPGFKGIFYGHGGPKQQSLFFSRKVFGGRCFRRVIFDEVQDLIEEGKEEKDCLLQLVVGGNCENVWLVTATPFPAGENSVYANHQLLGFHRLRIDVDYDPHQPCNRNVPFEIIKRKLYIRSSEEIRKKDAIKVSHTFVVQNVELTKLEHVMYEILLDIGKLMNIEEQGMWGEHFLSVRNAANHLACSPAIRSLLTSKKFRAGQPPKIKVPTSYELAFAGGMMALAGKVANGWQKECETTRDKIRELENDLIPALENTLVLSVEMKLVNESCPVSSSYKKLYEERIKHFLERKDIQKIRVPQAKEGPPVIIRQRDKILSYVEKHLATTAGNDKFFSLTARVLKSKQGLLGKLKTKVVRLAGYTRKVLDMLKQLSPGSVPKYGSKIQAVVDFIKNEVNDEKLVVFSATPDLPNILKEVFRREEIKCVHLKGVNAQRKADVISSFIHEKDVQVLLVPMQHSASGTNLQVAEHVVLLDIPGETPEASAATSHQAIGRVLRMGQTKHVQITSFVTDDTIETDMLAQMLKKFKELTSKEIDGYHCEKKAVVSRKPPKKRTRGSTGDIEEVKTVSFEKSLEIAMKTAEIIEIDDEGDDCYEGKHRNSNKEKTHPICSTSTTSSSSGDVGLAPKSSSSTAVTPSLKKRIKMEKVQG